MENGIIIIKGVKHKIAHDNIEDGCKECSLLALNVCQYNLLCCDVFDEPNSHFEIEE